MVKFQIILLWLAAWPVWAEPLDRRRIEELARANQPRLQAAEFEVEAARRLVDQAGMTPNPVFGLNTEAPALRTVSRLQMSLSQAVELGGKRQARLRLAEAVVQTTSARRQNAERELLLEVRQAFAELVAADLRRQLDQQAAELSLRQWELARGRFKLGDIPLVEVIELETDYSRRQAALQQAQAEVESRRAALAGWLGLPKDQLQVLGRLGSAQPLPEVEPLVRTALETRPDLQLARLERQRRQAETHLEETKGVSDLTLQAGLAYDRTYISPANFPSNGLTGVGEPVVSVVAGLSIPLPFNDDNSGNIEAARLRSQGAEAEQAFLERQIRSQVENAYWTVVANQKARRRLNDETLPLAARALKILEDAYRLRARTLTELLNARQAYLEAARSELEAARQEELALTRLEAAIFQEIPR